MDSGTETSTACTGSETACTIGSTSGLCVSGVCTPCNDPADDGNCSTAYGDAGTGFICNTAGSCVPGNCHSDANCTTVGQICGVTTANFCGNCTTDSQCQTDPTYGPGDYCASGLCMASSGCTADTTCTGNSADFCCSNSCVPGNCCTNAQCTVATSPICGASTPNTCGPCTSDSQCAGSAGGPVCDNTGNGGTTGECVAHACTGTPTATGGAPGTCTPSSNDMCCNMEPCIAKPSGTGVVACCPGSAGNTYCQSQLSNSSATCTTSFTCTTCDPVATTGSVSNPITYLVDPVNGSDGATGSGLGADAGATESCALKTITRALQLISVVGTAIPTQIVVVGASGGVTVGPGENFPLHIPANLTLTTETGPVTVQVANGKAGFTMNQLNSSIVGGTGAALTITTTVTTGTPPTGGTNGIQVTDGANSATTSISNLTVNGMLDDGILISGGSVSIGGGLTSSHNGITTATRAGIHVTGNGSAVIATSNGATPITLSNNTAHGILVDTNGSINLTGTITGTTTGTVVTTGNAAAGVWIEQTPGNVSVPQNLITGLMSFANTGGNGMRIVAGSNVKVRGSVFLGNSGNGVIISTYGAGASANNNIANIDLGDTLTNGGNTFQAALGTNNNGNAGICLNVAANSGALLAVGNQFSAANCATTAATLQLNDAGCGNSAAHCSSGVCDLGFGTAAEATGNSFNVAMCTQ